MRTPPLLADFIHHRVCKPICEKLLTLPVWCAVWSKWCGLMDMDFVRKRITELRMLRGKSEYQLSYETGHSKNYIHNIVTGYSQPSVTELLYLIDVLGVTPRDFFDEDTEYKNPLLAKQIMDGLKDMDEDDLRAVLAVVERLGKKD